MIYKSKNLILDNYNLYNFDLVLTYDYDDLDFNNGSLSEKGLILNDLFYYYDFDYSYNNQEDEMITSRYDYIDCNNESTNFIINKTGNTTYRLDDEINKYVIDFNGGYYYSDNQEVPNFSKGFTLNYWIKPSGNTYNYLLNLGDEKNGYGFYIKGNKIGYNSFVQRIDEKDELVTSNYNVETPEFNVGSNKWFNLTVIFKRNQENKVCCNDSDSIFSDEFDYVFGSGDTDPKYGKFPACIELGEIPDTHKGKLIFLVNARPIYSLVVEQPVIEEFLLKIGENYNGSMSIASMYSRPLSIPETIRNFYALKSIYKRLETFGGVNIIVGSDLVK